MTNITPEETMGGNTAIAMSGDGVSSSNDDEDPTTNMDEPQREEAAPDAPATMAATTTKTTTTTATSTPPGSDDAVENGDDLDVSMISNIICDEPKVEQPQQQQQQQQQAGRPLLAPPPPKQHSPPQQQKKKDEVLVRPTHHRRNSLELRKLPTNVLLTPQSECTELHDDDSCRGGFPNDGRNNDNENGRGIGGSRVSDMSGPDPFPPKQNKQSPATGFLRKTCLNSSFSLRTQMMLSFGLVSAFSILLVVAVCIAVSIMSGEQVNQITKKSYNDLIRGKEGDTSRYLAESLTLRLMPLDLVRVLHEAIRDRFSGYPMYEDDSQVPFFDIDSQTNIYPVLGPKLPMDWEQPNEGRGQVTAENAEEHLGHRVSWYEPGAPISTNNAFYMLQGSCDPTMTDPKGHSYWPNCTDEINNNMETGGLNPTPTNAQVYRKAADLSPLLKTLYEFYLDVREIGIYFANGGTGSAMAYPHYSLNSSATYESIGCNWLLDVHPLDSTRLIGSMQDHARCENNGIHENGKKVSSRLYTPMDRAWCRDQAKNPHKIMNFGPYQHAFLGDWLMSIGQAVYDRVTGEFIACVAIDFVLSSVQETITDSIVTARSEASIVRGDDEGTVIASSAWNLTTSDGSISVDELEIGVSKETFSRIKQLVDWGSRWDPGAVREEFVKFHVRDGGFRVSVFPMPPPPDTYDESYRPDFYVISSVSQQDIDLEVDSVSDSVSSTVQSLTILTLVVGLVGLCVIVIFILIVSQAITLPLKYMNEVSTAIVNTFGSHNDDGIPMTQTPLESRCSPKTELSDVVKQFQKMVSKFSGSAMAKPMQVNVTEINNEFKLAEKFSKLYVGRDDPGFKYRFSNAHNHASLDAKNEGNSSAPKSMLRHFGSVINDGCKSEATTFRASDALLGRSTLASPLFVWILALIVMPLLITTVVISTFVTYSISQGLFDVIDEAKMEYIFIETYVLEIHSTLRANYGALAMRHSFRDNYLMTRYLSWLLFGGLERTDSFPDLFRGTEVCKVFEELEDCGRVEEVPCDCSWNDPSSSGLEKCFNYDNDTRPLQKSMFFGLNEDIDANGSRSSTSFPNVAYTPETTSWWEGISEMPGSEKGANASGHGTTYDRLRVASAFPFYQTLYNSDPMKASFLGNTMFFEADGLAVGYNGCSYGFLHLSYWVSSEGNGASRINNDLCPIGKYGYDPRCRDWYATGKKLALENQTGLYVTPPYLFANTDGSDNVFGQTCTAPLIDPRTNEHVGQTLVDFVSEAIFTALEEGNNTKLSPGGFPFVITGSADMTGADTVIGPGFSLKVDPSIPIGDVVLPFDNPCPGSECTYRRDFEEIRERMQNGESGSASFVRTTLDGSLETVHVAFAPIKANIFVPVDGSDFSRGVNVSEFLVYSLALAETEEGLLAPFAEVESEIHKTIGVAIGVLACVIILSTAFVIYISNRITVSMTEPMIYLLQLIQHINNVHTEGNPPGVDVEDQTYGSAEVLNVLNTMETLHRVVLSANAAYFNGDVEKAYFFLSDAARLFKRLNNSKAEGVANNNLGNTMLAFYRTLHDSDLDELCGLGKQEVIKKGMGYYHKAIQLGEKAYDSFYEAEGWSPSCLEFMQHLSNRYFNRAMFLLTVKDSHDKPSDLEELGLRDLQISFDMDIEIVDQGTEVGWNVREVDKVFDVFLSRIRGHLLLLEMGYEDKWDVDETLDKAFDLLFLELNGPNTGGSPLFRDFCPTGRMQQIETELMRYFVIKTDLDNAAKIAIRILSEDEMTLQEAQLKAVDVLVMYERENSSSTLEVLKDLEDYQRWVQEEIEEYNKSRAGTDDWNEEQLPEMIKKSMRKLISDSESESQVESTKKTKQRLSSLRASTRGDVTMEIF